jgi:hypothetical protein
MEFDRCLNLTHLHLLHNISAIEIIGSTRSSKSDRSHTTIKSTCKDLVDYRPPADTPQYNFLK